jgi:hypothetical protein
MYSCITWHIFCVKRRRYFIFRQGVKCIKKSISELNEDSETFAEEINDDKCVHITSTRKTMRIASPVSLQFTIKITSTSAYLTFGYSFLWHRKPGF